MKRHIFASLLGIASACFVSACYGQGQINFANTDFGAALNAPVTFGVTAAPGARSGTAGVTVGSDFTASLLYSLDGGTTFNLLTAAQANDATYPTPFAFGTPGVADGDAGNFAGYFAGNPVTIPGYTSGPVTFIVQAWQGGSTFATATNWKGQSAAFTEPLLTTGTTQPNNFTTLTGFAVLPVPEPSIFALSGLGAAALMLIRRKK
jgi:hypothetical protein